jgi:hypothetical protein
MDLLENYLAAVRRNLPASQADDIVAELRDDLLAQAEERQERTGVGQPLRAGRGAAGRADRR